MSDEQNLSDLLNTMARRLETAARASAARVGDPLPVSSRGEGFSAAEIPYENAPGRRVAGLSFCERVAVLVWGDLSRLEERYRGVGRSLEELGTDREVARRLVATVPAPSPWNQALGAFYSPGKVARILGGISRQAVADRRSRGTLLGLKTADGKWVYPAFQFDDRHQVLEGLPGLVRCLREAELDDWSLAGWLVADRPELEGHSVVSWLRREGGVDRPLQLAREAVGRLSR